MQTWKTVKVFVSSTFRDMHSERDRLMRVVFPRLAEEAAKFRVHVLPIDLRWGVTQEESARSLEVCIDVLEECRPFFLGILGGRWGFVPEGGGGKSITALEIERAILHPFVELTRAAFEAALRKFDPAERARVAAAYIFHPGRRRFRIRDGLAPAERAAVMAALEVVAPAAVESLFFFRDAATTAAIAEPGFVEDDPRLRLRLETLKEEVRNVQARRGLAAPEIFTDLDALAEAVYQQLHTALIRRFGHAASGRAADPESEAQETFLARRLEGFVGRTREIEAMREFVEGRLADEGGSGWLCVHGESGTGKSALLARFATELAGARPDTLRVLHFAGASRGSATVDGLIRRIWRALAGAAIGSAQVEPDEPAERVARLPDLLAAAAAERPVCLVVDALDQMRATDGGSGVTAWLPRVLPARVAVVLSALPSAPLAALQRRGGSSAFLPLKPLPEIDARALAEEHARARQKRFSPAQMEALLAHREARKPLWLLVALAELTLTGRFESLDEQIAALPPRIPALFEAVLARLEADHGHDLVERVFSWIAVGRDGASERDILAMLDVPAARFAPFHLAARAYLAERGDEIDFFHRELGVAVRARYLQDRETVRRRHAEMARQLARTVFRGEVTFDAEAREGAPPRALRDLPWHLAKAAEDRGLATVLAHRGFLEAKVEAELAEDLAADYARAQEVLPETLRVAHPCGLTITPRIIELLGKAVGRDLAFLARHPFALLEQILDLLAWHDRPDAAEHFRVSESSPPPPRAEQSAPGLWALAEQWRRETAGRDYRIRRITPPMPPLDSALRVVLRGADGAAHGVHFSPNGRWIVTEGVDGRMRVWEAGTGRVRHVFPHAATPSISGDSRRIIVPDIDGGASIPEAAFASYARPVRVYDLESGDEIAVRDHNRFVTCAILTGDGRIAITAAAQELRVWEVDTGRDVFALTLPGAVSSAFLDPAETRLALGSEADWSLFDMRDGSLIHREAVAGVTDLRFSASGRKLLVASSGLVRLVALDEPGFPGRVIAEESYTRLRPSRELRRVALVAAGDSVRVLDLETGEMIFSRGKGAKAAALSPDGRRLALATMSRVIEVIDLDEGRLHAILRTYAGRLLEVKFSPDGQRIATVTSDGAVHLFDASRPGAALVRRGHEPDWVETFANSYDGGFVTTAFFDAGSRRVVTLARDGKGVLWDVASGTALLEGFESHPANNFADGFFSRARTTIVVCSNGGARGLDVVTGATKWVLDGFLRWSASPGRDVLAVGSADGWIRVFEVEHGQLIMSVQAHEDSIADLRFFDERRVVSAGSDGTLALVDGTRVWREQTGETGELRFRAGPAPEVLFWTSRRKSGLWWPTEAEIQEMEHIDCAAFSPAGRLLASRGVPPGEPRKWNEVCHVQIRDIAGGEIRAVLGPVTLGLAGERTVDDIAFSPDGRSLVTFFCDPSSRPWASVWEVATGVLRETVELAGKTHALGSLRELGFPKLAGEALPAFRVLRNGSELVVQSALGVPYATLPENPSAVWLSPDLDVPTFLATAEDGTVSFFRLEPPREGS